MEYPRGVWTDIVDEPRLRSRYMIEDPRVRTIRYRRPGAYKERLLRLSLPGVFYMQKVQYDVPESGRLRGYQVAAMDGDRPVIAANLCVCAFETWRGPHTRLRKLELPKRRVAGVHGVLVSPRDRGPRGGLLGLRVRRRRPDLRV